MRLKSARKQNNPTQTHTIIAQGFELIKSFKTTENDCVIKYWTVGQNLSVFLRPHEKKQLTDGEARRCLNRLFIIRNQLISL